MKVAARLHKPVQWCQQRVTSSEFIDWLTFFEEEEKEKYKANTKEDHYFALLALKIHQVLEVLCDVKQQARKTLQDMLLQFTQPGEDGEEVEYEVVRKNGQPKHNPYKPLPRDEHGKLIGGIDTDDPAPLPPRWQKVNERAKFAIGAMLGMPPEEIMPDGHGSGT